MRFHFFFSSVKNSKKRIKLVCASKKYVFPICCIILQHINERESESLLKNLKKRNFFGSNFGKLQEFITKSYERDREHLSVIIYEYQVFINEYRFPYVNYTFSYS